MQFTIANFWKEQLKTWLENSKLLAQACLVAISLQIALFPILWFIGWALPWPKSPIITTIIEYELDNSNFKPKDIYKYRDPKLNH